MLGATNVQPAGGGESDAGVYIIDEVTLSGAETIQGQADGLLVEKERNVETLRSAGISASIDEPTESISQKMEGLTNALNPVLKTYYEDTIALQDIPPGLVLAQNMGGVWNDRVYTNGVWTGSIMPVWIQRTPNKKNMLIPAGVGINNVIYTILLNKLGIDRYIAAPNTTITTPTEAIDPIVLAYMSENGNNLFLVTRRTNAIHNFVSFYLNYDDKGNFLAPTYVSHQATQVVTGNLHNLVRVIYGVYDHTMVISYSDGSYVYNGIYKPSYGLNGAWLQFGVPAVTTGGTYWQNVTMRDENLRIAVCMYASSPAPSTGVTLNMRLLDFSQNAPATIANYPVHVHTPATLFDANSTLASFAAFKGGMRALVIDFDRRVSLIDISNISAPIRLATVGASALYNFPGYTHYCTTITDDSEYFAVASIYAWNTTLAIQIFKRNDSALGFDVSKSVFNTLIYSTYAVPQYAKIDIIENVGYELVVIYGYLTQGTAYGVAMFRCSYENHEWEAMPFDGDLSNIAGTLPNAARLGVNLNDTIPAGESFDFAAFGEFITEGDTGE